MPFAELPGSHIQGLQTPDWTQFGRQANEAIMRGAELRLQESQLTSNAINNAVDQINQILQMASPEGRLERALKREQLSAMIQTYQDYHAHPENYLLTAHGPVHRDVPTELLKGARFKQALSAASLNEAKQKQLEGTGSINDFINGLRAKSNFGGSEYNNLPVNGAQDAPTVVPTLPSEGNPGSNPAPDDDNPAPEVIDDGLTNTGDTASG